MSALIAQYKTRRGTPVDVRPNPGSPRNIVAGCHGCRMANGSTAANAADLMRGWAQVHAANCDS
ncbi:hypothetical protein ADK53_28690 [Streptomyces sp. WM6373]|uniref:hypothetical protein n=1 Tax=Streptomyces sp. WM6373 TaxID=1415556 RepID=UPI0006AE708A|nr:hypothetical protein [Streptomyces sp. WM6373]KOU30198.1 hypothetical protein ADK53_28690 [Streptomyces sp. WM6373]